MMTDPAEQLRAMMNERAADVQQLPEQLTKLAGLTTSDGPRRRTRHRQFLIAASAASVLIVGVATGLIARHSHDGAPPAPTAPALRSGPPATHSTSPSPADPTVCAHVDKTDLGHAVSAGFHNPYPHANSLIAVAPDGSAYDMRYGSAEIVRINANGTTTRVLGPLPGLSGGPTGASVDKHYLAIGVPVTGGSGGQGPTSVYLVTQTTGQVRTIRAATAQDPTVVLGPALLDGHVYWTEIDAGAAATSGRVRDFDIASGSTRTIGSNAVSAPLVSGGGLYWSSTRGVVTYRRGTLPRGFTPLPGKAYGSFVADGASAAWLRYRDAEAQIVVQQGVRAPRVIATGDDVVGSIVDALSGPLVFWHNGSGREFVFDSRTDVVASNLLSDIVTGPPVAANGVLTLPGPNGSFALVRAAVLAPLRC